MKPDMLLPLANDGNRALFIRLLAHAIVGLVRSSNDNLVRSMLHHEFTTISSAAAIRLSEILGEAALTTISTEVDDAIRGGRSRTLASAIGAAEERLYIPPSNNLMNRRRGLVR